MTAIEALQTEVERLRLRVAALEQANTTLQAENAALRRERPDAQRTQIETDLHIFKTLVEKASDGISVISADGTLQYANPAYDAMHGYDTSMIGMSIVDITRESEEREHALDQLQQNPNWHGQTIHSRADHTTFVAQSSAFVINLDEQQDQAVGTIIRDITQQIRQERQLQMFQAVIEHALDGVVLVSPESIVFYANAAFKQITGFGDSLIGRRVTDLYDEETRTFILTTVIPTVTQKGGWQGTITYQRPDGNTWVGNASVVLVRDKAGTPLARASIVRDLTDALRAEEERADLQRQVIEAQRAALRELSTPLIPISQDVVIMPLIGTIDDQRAQQVLETLLEGVAHYQAELAILDITGVSDVDAQVAQAILQAARSVRLLGARVMLTGMQPRIAQMLTHLEIDLGDLVTHGTLQAGIAAALR